MGSTVIDTLRVSPKYTSDDWNRLDQDSPDDWPKAAEIVEDRLEGRFLSFATECLKSPNSGFVVLSIDSMLMETIQQFRDGITDGRGKSKALITKYLTHDRFQSEFSEMARASFFEDIRCGLLHQAEARKMWLIRRDQEFLLQEFPHGDGYIVDIKRFHEALKNSFKDYLLALQAPDSSKLRTNLWVKMNSICNVRDQRGAFFGEIS